MNSYTGKGYEIYEGLSYSNNKNRRERLLTKESQEIENRKSAGEKVESRNVKIVEASAVYEGSTYIPKKVTYTFPSNAQKSQDKTEQKKELYLKKEEQYEQIAKDSLNGQLEAYRKNNAASVWKLLSSGDLAMETESKTKAKADVSEDGYWGVIHTSERLFDFAMTMSEGSPERMKNMRTRMELAVESVIKDWGGELPGLCQDTIQSTRSLFAKYLAREGEIVN